MRFEEVEKVGLVQYTDIPFIPKPLFVIGFIFNLQQKKIEITLAH